MEALHIKDLSFRYPQAEKNALESVSLSVNKGDFVVVCGQSGCGKTTLLKLLKRELAPFGKQTGEIIYNGIPLPELDSRTAAGEIGFVLQNPESQIVTDTVWHELAFGLENLGFPKPVIRRRMAEMASYFGIEEWFHKRTADLSGGQKQLLNLASVMAMNPKLLLLDEPTAQLDPITAANFIATLQKINRELGLTILLIEHRLEEVFPIADRVLLLDDGKLIFDDKPRKISAFFKKNPDHPMLAGLPAAMRIFGELEEEGDSPITVREGREYVTGHYGNVIDTLEKDADAKPSETALELKNVWFRYQKDLPDILKGVYLKVQKGEHFCILGGNGAGKTTALYIMAGLLKPYHGKVLIEGKKITDYSNNELYLHNIALLPQNPQTVFLEKALEEDFVEICKIMKYSDQEAKQRIQSVAQKLGIFRLLAAHPYDLSGGEQQKAALAKILLLQPKILLMDEPTKGIDAFAKQTLADIILRLKKEGITVITVTHDVEFAAANADRCAMFFDGQPVSVDTPTAFFSQNNFYTTAANRIARGHYQNAVLCEEVVALCKLNGKKGSANHD